MTNPIIEDGYQIITPDLHKQFEPKLATDELHEKNIGWVPVAIDDGLFSMFTTYRRKLPTKIIDGVECREVGLDGLIQFGDWVIWGDRPSEPYLVENGSVTIGTKPLVWSFHKFYRPIQKAADKPNETLAASENASPSAAEISKNVHALINERIAKGIATYGKPLSAFNGRDGLKDLSEELIDAVFYVEQMRVETEGLRANIKTLRDGFVEYFSLAADRQSRIAILESKLSAAQSELRKFKTAIDRLVGEL